MTTSIDVTPVEPPAFGQRADDIQDGLGFAGRYAGPKEAIGSGVRDGKCLRGRKIEDRTCIHIDVSVDPRPCRGHVEGRAVDDLVRARQEADRSVVFNVPVLASVPLLQLKIPFALTVPMIFMVPFVKENVGAICVGVVEVDRSLGKIWNVPLPVTVEPALKL